MLCDIQLEEVTMQMLFQGNKILLIWSCAWDASVKRHPTVISHFTVLEASAAHSSFLRYTGKRLGDQQFQVIIQTRKEVRIYHWVHNGQWYG
jgi:hypothetical protein